MPRKRKWEFGDIVVTHAHIRLWMQTVGHRIPTRSYHRYVRDYDVPAKIARELAAGTFMQTVEREADRANVRPRKMRTPGTLARLRTSWATATNDTTYQAHHNSCIAR